jgi:hypothetical protein
MLFEGKTSIMLWMTYIKDNRLHSHFSKTRQSSKEHIGIDFVSSWLKVKHFDVSKNDRTKSGDLNPSATDLKATKNNLEIDIEVEVKSDKIWHYILQGIDIPSRKGKYLQNPNFVHFMVKEDKTEFLMTPGIYLELANQCVGFKGQGSIKDSSDFSMPTHECHIVRKFCNAFSYHEVNDFFRIPYRYTFHYKKEENGFKLVNTPSFYQTI